MCTELVTALYHQTHSCITGNSAIVIWIRCSNYVQLTFKHQIFSVLCNIDNNAAERNTELLLLHWEFIHTYFYLALGILLLSSRIKIPNMLTNHSVNSTTDMSERTADYVWFCRKTAGWLVYVSQLFSFSTSAFLSESSIIVKCVLMYTDANLSWFLTLKCIH